MLVALVIAAAILAVVAAGAAAKRVGGEESPWQWVDRGSKLLDVSCSAPLQCIAVGADGAILRSTPPSPTTPLAWDRVPLPADEALVSVSCRGTLCIAISGGDGTTAGVSKVFRSTDSGATWAAPTRLPPATVAGGAKSSLGGAVACHPTGSCVIAGPAGGIWRSNDQGQTWNPLKDSSLGLRYRALACPANGVCILVGNGKPVVLRGNDATAIPAPTTANLLTIACESATTCTAADSLGSVISISDPWKGFADPVDLPGGLEIDSLACPAANTCVGLTGKGPVLRTTKRSKGEWSKRPTGTAKLLAVDCAGESCAAVGKAANWYGSQDTGFGWSQVNAVDGWDAIDCGAGSSGAGCVAGGMDSLGRSSNGNLWTTPFAPGSLSIKAVSCAAFPGCIALSDTATFATPDGGLTWRERLPAASVGHGPEAGVCFDADRCVAVGHGAVFTTFDGARTGWAVGSLPTAPGDGLKGIACPTTTTCVVATTEGIYRGDLTVTGDAVSWKWTASDADPSDPLNAIACSSPGHCAAVGFAGQVLTTTDPTYIHWSAKKIGTGPVADRPPLSTVACPADGVCVAAGARGFIATTTNDWADWSLDQVGPVPKPTIAGIGCRSPTRCIAVGDTVLAGRR